MKKIQDTEANSESIIPSQEDALMDKHLPRRIFSAFLLLILFAWHRCTGAFAKTCAVAASHCVPDKSDLYQFFVSGQIIEAVIIGVLGFPGMLILRIPYTGAVYVFVAVTVLVSIFGAWLGGRLGVFLICW